jgi:predicted alpha/beta-fold hydrolase
VASLIESAFKPAWWLANGHLQTLWPALVRRAPNISVQRERMITQDGDFIDLDWCGGAFLPLVILVHGLTGSSRSGYIRGMQRALLNHGFRSVAMNFRGCGGESNRSARCYHSGDTEDLHQLYRTLKQREPETPMAAVGYSLGGNVLLKWLGEQGSAVSLFAAAAVSVPLVLGICADRMDSGLSRIYRNRLIRHLKRYIRDKRASLRLAGQVAEAEKLERLGDLSSIRSFWEYDNRVIAGLYPFRDVHDYYQKSSSRQFLKSIRVKTLLIQARDDPFMSPAVLPAEDELSPALRLEVASSGGHVGFVSGRLPGRPRYWLEQRIPEFLKAELRSAKPIKHRADGMKTG